MNVYDFDKTIYKKDSSVGDETEPALCDGQQSGMWGWISTIRSHDDDISSGLYGDIKADDHSGICRSFV